jgi:ubiquinone/menaquinone biosynthesis C-methylase UbiE
MNPSDLVDVASRYWQSAALNAAVQLGVFELLAAKPADAAGVARGLDASPLHTEALLDALAGMGVLHKDAGGYGLPDALRAVLDPASSDSLLPALRFNADLFGLWARLGESVRTGTPAMPGNPHLGTDPARMRRFVEGMHSRAGLMARGLLPCLRPPAGSRILDVGGGPGTFALKLAQRDASLRLTVLDLPPVVAAAAEIHAGQAGIDRIAFLGGNYHLTPLPPGQDIVLYCGALHQEPEEAVAPLFARMRAALRPGGQIWVVDLLLDDDRCTPAYSALFQVNMLLMRPTARVHAASRVVELLAEAGFRDATVRPVPDTPYRLVEAINPESP